jgi:BRCA1-associated protein
MPNRCMALIKFRTTEAAVDFQEEYDGRPFWAMLDDEVCHIVRIRSVEVTATVTPPFTTPFNDVVADVAPSGTIELPTCPVCLERMDSSVTGLCTILCQHTFHCGCIRCALH